MSVLDKMMFKGIPDNSIFGIENGMVQGDGGNEALIVFECENCGSDIAEGEDDTFIYGKHTCAVCVRRNTTEAEFPNKDVDDLDD